MINLSGQTTVVTGLEKGSGKTTFLNLAARHARAHGPVALFTIGVDGAQKAQDGVPSSRIQVEEGDVVLTTEGFARSSDARFEVLDAFPGRSSLGNLLLARTLRRGGITLVGCDHLSTLASCLAQVRSEGWAATLLVDGAASRLTQVGALACDGAGEVGFVFTARVDPSNLCRAVARLRAIAALAALAETSDTNSLHMEGPLTPEVLKALPTKLSALSIADLTQCFLEPEDLARLQSRTALSVRRRLPLRGFLAALRNLPEIDFRKALGDAAELLWSNPFEVAA